MSPVFGWIFGQGNVPAHEMARTFNCGVGAVLVIGKEVASAVLQQLKASNEQAWIIGSVTRCEDNGEKVTISNLEEVLSESAEKADIKVQDAKRTVNGPVKRPKLSSEREENKSPQMKVGVLISGSGTNLQALIDQSLRQDSSAKIVLVISNIPGVQGLKRAEAAGIPTKVSLFLVKESSELTEVSRYQLSIGRDLKMQRRRRQRERERQKSNRLRLAFARASRFFVHFVAVTARLPPENAYFHVLGRT